jgi:hypothetical protein
MALACGVAAEAQTRVWSVRTETLGWRDPYIGTAATARRGPWYETNDDFDLGEIWSQELAVDTTGLVYVSFGVKGPGPGMNKLLRVVALDGEHGTVKRQMDFPTPRLSRTAVMLASDGVALVVAGDRVQRWNGDGTVGSSIPIPPQPKMNPSLWVRPSSSGRTLLLTTDEIAFQFVRTDTLATIAECKKENDEIETIADNMAVSMAEDAQHQFELHAGAPCGAMPLLWKVPYGRSSRVHLLNDEALLEIGGRGIKRLTLGDKTVWSWSAPGELIPTDIAGVAMSQNGERLAMELEVVHRLRPIGCMECRGPEYESWGAAVAVLDAATGRLVAQVPLDHAKLNKLGLALSPDGRKLVVLNGDVLELWAL